MMAFHAYLLRCNDGSYYAGHTDDLEQRMAQHRTGALGGYTAKRRPVVLVWSDSFQTRDDAFAVERKLKGWSRAKKQALIAGDWQMISQLARSRKAFGAGVARGLRQAQAERGWDCRLCRAAGLTPASLASASPWPRRSGLRFQG
jgi:predicted GIY-YIG superfamily endonuclease